MRLNPNKMKRFLPCSKVEIIQTVEDKGICLIYLATTVKQIDEKKYELACESLAFETFEDAYLFALKWMLDSKAKENMSFAHGRSPTHTDQIKHIITVTEGVRGRDGGSSWADPYNDVVGTGELKIEVWANKPEFRLEYQTGYCSLYALVGLSKAIILKNKMEEIYLPSKETRSNYVAFSCHGYVFNDIKWLNDLRVAGTSCDKLYYNEYEDDYVGIFDMLENIIFFQERNVIYYVGENIYLNGEKIITMKELLNNFPNCAMWQIKDSVPKDVEKFFVEKYPFIKEISTYNEGRTIGE